jgi:glycosyltransferase involved in cell wall biosynthesis
MKTIKIAYCTPSLYIPGGVERVLTTKVNYLADVLGYDVTLILTDGEGRAPAYPLSPRVRVVNLGIGFEELWRLSFLRKIPVYLRKQRLFRQKMEATLRNLRPDITVSTLRREINFLTALGDGSRKVGELHVCRSHYRNFEEGDSNAVKSLFARLWMGSLVRKLKRLDRFVVLTHEDRACWPELERVSVIPNPLDFDSERKADPAAHRVIAAGRYVYQKGFDLLIEAWSRLCTRYPDWELHIYGKGDKAPFQALAERLHATGLYLEDSTPKIVDKYLKSSVFVLSSRFEGFGMVMVEAMRCALPAVSFACPCGPRDIILPERNGLLARDGDVDDLARQLARLMDDESLRRRMGAEAVESAHRYDVEVIMKQWDELFRSLTDKNVKA